MKFHLPVTTFLLQKVQQFTQVVAHIPG